MSPRHLLLALSIAAIWGFNFVVIRVGLTDFPPLLMTTLRFMLVSLAVPFVRRPDIGWGPLILIGSVWFTGQFGFLFVGMANGMPPGLASVVLQSQAFFTAMIAALVLRERPRPRQIAGIAVAFAGIGLIGFDTGQDVTMTGLALCMAAALAWGTGNVLVKRMGGTSDLLGLVAWLSLVPPIPLLILSIAFEGPARIESALVNASLMGIGALLYIGIFSTIFAFSAWGRLLRLYPAGTVAPFSLLVPVFGMASAVLLLGEAVTPVRLIASVFILAGLCLVALPARFFPSFGRRPA